MKRLAPTVFLLSCLLTGPHAGAAPVLGGSAVLSGRGRVDMPPCFAVGYVPHAALVNSVVSGDCSKSFTRSNPPSDFYDLRRCDLGAGPLLATKDSALRNGVLHVVSLSSEKEVTWTHAPRIVASMANDHAFRDWAKGQFPRGAVRANPVFFRLGDMKPTVAGSGEWPHP
jgi:hypothetical protein